MGVITKDLLQHLYVSRGLSDREIANFIGVDRSHVSYLRRSFGISTRTSLGEIGEKYAKSKLEKLGFYVENMNEFDKNSPFDLRLDNRIRIEIKSTSCINGSFKFQLSEKIENENIVSENRIRLPNGRTKKIFRKTCDYLIFVCIHEKKAFSLIIPSRDLSDTLQTLSFPISKDSKYKKYLNNWSQIKKSDAPTSDQQKRSV